MNNPNPYCNKFLLPLTLISCTSKGRLALSVLHQSHMAVALSQAISFSLSFSRLEKLLQCLSASLCSSPQHPTEPPRASLQSVPSLWSCAHQSVSAAWHSKEEPLSWGLMAAPVPVQPLLQLTFAMAALPHRLLLHLLSVHQGAQVLSCQPVFYPANAHLLPCVV